MSDEKIGELRRKIDELDERIVGLLDERMAIAREIGEVKRREGKKIVVREREKNVLERVKNIPKKMLSNEWAEKIFRKIIQATTEAEKK